MITVVLSACASERPAPSPPSAARTRQLISEASNAGTNGYAIYQVSFVQFIAPTEWAKVTTKCVKGVGITQVDFSKSHDPYWSPAPPQGIAAMNRALVMCSLQYPETYIRSGFGSIG